MTSLCVGRKNAREKGQRGEEPLEFRQFFAWDQGDKVDSTTLLHPFADLPVFHA